MASNTVIQIKRSSSTATPANGGLSIAEPAYSYSSGYLFLGNNTGDGVTTVGGEYTVLTSRWAASHANAAFAAANSAGSSTGIKNAFDQANTALAQANTAYDQANLATKLAFGTIATDTGSAVADSNNDTVTVLGANGVSVLGVAANDSIWVALNKTAVTPSTYGGADTQMPYFVVDAQGRLTSAGNTTITSSATALSTAQGAVNDAANANSRVTTVGAASNNWANTVANYANGYSNSTFVKLTAQNQTITGNLAITGALTVSGNAFTIDTTTLNVTDPLIYLAGNNYVSDTVDIGFVGNYVNTNSQNVHTGFFRDATIKEYYLFHEYNKEPEPNHIDTAGNNFTLAVLNAAIRTSNLNLAGANAVLTLRGAFDTANGAVNDAANSNSRVTLVGAASNGWANSVLVSAYTWANTVGNAANSYARTVGDAANTNASDGSYISTGIVRVAYGGTGATTHSNNYVLLGNTIGAIKSVGSSTEGHILKISNAGLPEFGMLDGGTF